MSRLFGLHTTFVQKLSLTYYTHNLPFAQSRLAQPAGQPAIVHHRCRCCLPLSAGLNYACTSYYTYNWSPFSYIICIMPEV